MTKQKEFIASLRKYSNERNAIIDSLIRHPSFIEGCIEAIKESRMNGIITEKDEKFLINDLQQGIDWGQKMEKRVKCGVDAGVLCFMDLGFAQKKGAIWGTESYYHVIPLAPGKYKINYDLAESWDGPKEDVFEIEITETKDGEGLLYVGDPCYIFDDSWDTFLDDTNFCKSDSDEVKFIQTGGDGEFEMSFTISKE